MLGTMTDAEDVVQDAYLRWHESDRDEVRAVEAVLVTTVMRLSIDRQRRLKTERESYFGTWLPEPWLGHESDGGHEQKDDLSYAALVLLERLSVDERAAFLLREVFDFDYQVLADTLDKNEPACRKLVQRAKSQLAEAGAQTLPRHSSALRAQSELLVQLLAACRAQDAQVLEQLLVPGIRLVSDGGGKVFAARYVLQGAARVARTLWRFVRKGGPQLEEYVVDLHGEPVIATYLGGALYGLSFVAPSDSQIQTLYMLLNPDKLRGLEAHLPAYPRARENQQSDEQDPPRSL